jgi:hypothetical protein
MPTSVNATIHLRISLAVHLTISRILHVVFLLRGEMGKCTTLGCSPVT